MSSSMDKEPKRIIDKSTKNILDNYDIYIESKHFDSIIHNYYDNNRIKKIRTENKMSQQKLGEKLGVSRQAISLYEKGNRYPSEKNWLKMSVIFASSIKKEISGQKVKPTDYLKGFGLLDSRTINLIIRVMHNTYFLSPILSSSGDEKEDKKAKATFINSVNSYIEASDIHPLLKDFYSNKEKKFLLTSDIKKYWRKNFFFLFDNLNTAENLRIKIKDSDRLEVVNYISKAIDAYNFRINKSLIGQKFKSVFAPIDEINHAQMTRQLNFAKTKKDISKIIDSYKSELDILKNRLLK